MGGGAMHIDLPIIQLSTSSSNPPSVSSLASSNLNFPNSANYTAPLKQSRFASCSCHSDTCKKPESVDGTEDKTASGSLNNIVFNSVPSKFEVEHAVAALQSFVLGIAPSSEPKLKWLQPLLGSCDLRMLLSQGYGRIYDTFRLLHTDPSVKRLVVSLSSDKAVWDAVTSNELVRKLLEAPYPAENQRHLCSDEEPNLGTDILRWILDTTKAKVMELIEKFQLLMNEVFYPNDRRRPAEETPGNLEDKVRSSLLLSLVILLIVVVSRLQRLA